MKRLFGVLSLVAAFSAAVHGQICTSLPVTTAGGNGQSGYMFDVDNISGGSVNITGFSVFGLNAGATTIEIRTLNAAGSYTAAIAANLVTAANWTLVGSAPVALATTLTPVPVALAVPIAPGSTQAFYVTCVAGANLSYTTGTVAPLVLGGIIATDGVLQCRGGNGMAYPFAGAFGGTVIGAGGRLFRGAVSYTCGAPPPAEYQVNSPDSSLAWNGVQGGAYAKANTTVCAGTAVTVTGTTGLAGVFEWAYNLAPTISMTGGAILTGGGQLLNLNLAGGLFFLNGGLAPSLLPHPGVLPLGFAMPGGLTVSAAQVVAPSAHPDGFTLSQSAQINGTPGTTGGPGPVGDDVALVLTAGTVIPGSGLPACSAGYTVPTIALYGTTYTQYSVVTNGRVVMGPVLNTSYTPTNPYLASEAPFAGCHTDFNTLVNGNIVVDNVASALQVDYNAVGYFGGTAAVTSTLRITIDASSTVTISNITLGTAVAYNAFLGVHPGGIATIEAGFPASYVGAGLFTSAVAGNSHGVFAPISGGLTDPADTMTFGYNAAGGYNVTY